MTGYQIRLLMIAVAYIWARKYFNSKEQRHTLMLAFFNFAILIALEPLYFSYFRTLFNSAQLMILRPWDISWLGFLGVFVLADLVYYVTHRLSHAVEPLWRFHAVHHSGKEMSLMLHFRISPAEYIWKAPFEFLPIFLGAPMIPMLFSFRFSTWYQFIMHHPTWKYPNWLGYLFVSPQHHRVHHSEEIHMQNSNFAGVFNIWDRIFGTYQVPIEIKNYGVTDWSDNPHPTHFVYFKKK